MLTYYTLEEATHILGTTPDQAKKLLEEHRIRQYRDGRGKVRYVATAVNELARTLGRGSDMELQLGEAARAKTGNTPPPSKAASTTLGSPEVFDFDLSDAGDRVEFGQEVPPDPPSSRQKSGRSGPKLSDSPPPGPKSGPGSSSGQPTTPRPGSDSDVRLIADGSDLGFQIASDSDVKIVDESRPLSSPPPRKKQSAPKGDSGVRIIPMDFGSDSDVKLVPDSPEGSSIIGRPPPGKTASDSDIRLHAPPVLPKGRGKADEGSDDSMVTEEIDLDAEHRKAEEAARSKQGQRKLKPKRPRPQTPTSSPFELSESDVEIPSSAGGLSASSLLSDSSLNDSSDVDLTPASAKQDLSPIEISSDEIVLHPAEGDVNLGKSLTPDAHDSGISLASPADSGISLEQSGSGEIDFELVMDESSTPKPASTSPVADDSSSEEFELSLDSSAEVGISPIDSSPATDDSDSEFELSLDAETSSDEEGAAASEFELTLDDGGGLVAVDDEGASAVSESDEKDIFETDFEVPPLDEESGSQAVALDESDTDLESSDFDLALGDEDMAAEEESGSQVVALEDEAEADDSAGTIAKPRRRGGRRAASPAMEEEVEELLGDEEIEAEEEPRRAPAAAAVAAPAAWGVLPALVLLPCVVVMFVVGLMGFELVHGMWGYHQSSHVSSFLLDALSRQFTDDLPPREK